MNIISRQSYMELWDELSSEKEMIFLAGPRQAGKTTLTKEIAKKYKNSLYYNWDILSDKKKIIENPAFFQEMNRVDSSKPLIIMDEIHKYKKWKNYLKGIYDEFHENYQFLISGSGRLNVYQRGGDSLAGRYLLFHLFPFTISELGTGKASFLEFAKDPTKNFETNNITNQKIWRRLERLSGFPEPYSKNKETFWVKWTNNYSQQIIREDIRDLSGIRDTAGAAVLFSLLPSKVGSPLSMNSLAGDLQISFNTVKNWLDMFDSTYLTFRISPWVKKISRAITKENKLYLFNYPLVSEKGPLLENMAALDIYKTIKGWNEKGYGTYRLHYIRNKEKEEVDFLISNNNIPFFMVETKNSDTQPSDSLINFQNTLKIPAIQLTNKAGIRILRNNGDQKLLIATAWDWLASLPS